MYLATCHLFKTAFDNELPSVRRIFCSESEIFLQSRNALWDVRNTGNDHWIYLGSTLGKRLHKTPEFYCTNITTLPLQHLKQSADRILATGKNLPPLSVIYNFGKSRIKLFNVKSTVLLTMPNTLFLLHIRCN